jgi:5-methylcytosine-specific restriction endonuclease McrA
MTLPNILLPQTYLRPTPFGRNHQPHSSSYSGFQPCLRWEFAFTCAFCRRHETDFTGGIPLKKSAAGHTEHFLPQSSHPQFADTYTNCYYSCRECNLARKTKLNVARDGARLLDPCQAAWVAHFVLTRNDVLRPRVGDRDAAYTESAYELNSDNKIERRIFRRERIQEALRELIVLEREGWSFEGKVAALGNEELLSNDERDDLAIARWRTERRIAELARFPLIPQDAPGSCQCSIASSSSVSDPFFDLQARVDRLPSILLRRMT